MTIIYLGVCWFVGLWLASLLAPDLVFWLAGAGGAGLTAVLARHQPGARLLLACVAVLCLGGARYILALPDIGPDQVTYYNDQAAVTLIGLVVDEPDVRDQGVNLRVQAEQIVLADGRIQPVTGLVLVQTPRYPVIDYGARLRLNGRLQTPPSSPEFSYRDYLARHNIHSLMTWPPANRYRLRSRAALAGRLAPLQGRGREQRRTEHCRSARQFAERHPVRAAS